MTNESRTDWWNQYLESDDPDNIVVHMDKEIERLRAALVKISRDEWECPDATCEGWEDCYWRVVNIARGAIGNKPPADEPRVGLTCFQVTDNEMAWKIASQDEPSERRCDCWERISALIVNGPLEGDGLDPTAQRNGIILAANHIAPFNRPAPQGASRDASPADLVGALQDVVHTDPGPARAGRVAREWNFERYRSGKLMAQGVKVHAVNYAEAYEKAVKCLFIDGNKPTDELRLANLTATCTHPSPTCDCDREEP